MTERFDIVGYCRISVDEELDRDNVSIENQKAIIADFVQSRFPGSSLAFFEDRDRCGLYHRRGTKACTSHHIRVETLDRLVKEYVKKVMETSSAMLAKLNADMDKEEDDIAETQRAAENLEKLIEACRRSKRAQKTAKWPLRTATTVKMPKNWLFPLLKIPFTAQGGICVLMLSPAVKLKEYVEVLKLTADEEIHRLFFM